MRYVDLFGELFDFFCDFQGEHSEEGEYLAVLWVACDGCADLSEYGGLELEICEGEVEVGGNEGLHDFVFIFWFCSFHQRLVGSDGINVDLFVLEVGKDVANALVVEKVVFGYLRTVESDKGNEFGLDWAREVVCFIFIHASKDISDKRKCFSCFNG